MPEQSNKHPLRFRLITASLLLCAMTTLLLPRVVHAEKVTDYQTGWEIIPAECLHADYQDANGNPVECGLNSFINLFVNLAHLGIKILPYLTMIMVIWAGYNLIMAGGNPNKIEEGKKMLTSVFLGIIIILILAWVYSFFIISVFTNSTKIFPNTPFQTDWWGGGNGEQQTPESGCCTVIGGVVGGEKMIYGCQNTKRTECEDGLENRYNQAPYPTFPESVANFTPNTSCEKNFKSRCTFPSVDTCCVPIPGSATKVCYYPDEHSGCLNHPETRIKERKSCENLQPDPCSQIK